MTNYHIAWPLHANCTVFAVDRLHMETVLSPIAKGRQREVLLDDSRGCLSGCVGRRVGGDLYNFVRELFKACIISVYKVRCFGVRCWGTALFSNKKIKLLRKSIHLFIVWSKCIMFLQWLEICCLTWHNSFA